MLCLSFELRAGNCFISNTTALHLATASNPALTLDELVIPSAAGIQYYERRFGFDAALAVTDDRSAPAGVGEAILQPVPVPAATSHAVAPSACYEIQAHAAHYPRPSLVAGKPIVEVGARPRSRVQLCGRQRRGGAVPCFPL